MNLREYDHITRSPDTFPRSTLVKINKVLGDIDSQYTSLIDNVLANGYIKPPQDYKWHGFYRITLSANEKQAVLDELGRAIKELSDKHPYQGNGIEYVRQFYNYWERCIEERSIPVEEALQSQQYYDLRGMSIGEFENFIFEHDVFPENEEDSAWYHDHEMWIDYDSNRVIELYVSLFKQSHELLRKFSRGKLEQGFWAILGPGLCKCSISDLIWDDKINIEHRLLLITSMYELYANLFSVDPLDTSCNMWWDSLAYDFNPMKQRTRKNPEERKIQDAMFETLCRILELESEECRLAALHGLGHVLHPNTEEVIKTHLRKYVNVEDEYRVYAQACIKGDVM